MMLTVSPETQSAQAAVGWEVAKYEVVNALIKNVSNTFASHRSVHHEDTRPSLYKEQSDRTKGHQESGCQSNDCIGMCVLQGSKAHVKYMQYMV